MTTRVLAPLACLTLLLLPAVATAQVGEPQPAAPVCNVRHGLLGLVHLVTVECHDASQELLFVRVTRFDGLPACEVRVLGTPLPGCDPRAVCDVLPVCAARPALP